MRKLRFLLNPLMLFLLAAAFILSCRKMEITQAITTQEKFFTASRTNDAVEKALALFLERKNQKQPFVEETVKKIGYPRWDKIMKKGVQTNRVTLAGRGEGEKTKMSVTGADDVYYVPFVRDAQNNVNAVMIIHASTTDTTIGYACDWQYNGLLNVANDPTKNKARNFALSFMRFDKMVFGHTKFKINNKALFTTQGRTPPSEITVELGKKENLSAPKTNLVYLESCEDIIIALTYCPWTISDGHCIDRDTGAPLDFCDHCERCPTTYQFYTHCEGEWVDDSDGADGPVPGGDEGGGVGGGGGVPPGCGGGNPTPESTKPGVFQGSVRVNVVDPNDPCGPGWEPDPAYLEAEADMEWFNSTPTYNIDFNTANIPPCISEIITKVLSASNTVGSMIKQKFSESSKFNIKFGIDNTSQYNGYTDVTDLFYEKRENIYGKFSKMNLTIKINAAHTSTKMFFAKTILHELLHSYFYYRQMDAFGNAAKTLQLEKDLGWLKPYDPNNPPTQIEKAQHQQMTVFWVDKMVKGLKAFQTISETDLVKIREVYPNITLDEYYEAIAWAGLGIGGNDPITTAWEDMLQNDPTKAAMYKAVQLAEQDGTILAASKTKCN